MFCLAALKGHVQGYRSHSSQVTSHEGEGVQSTFMMLAWWVRMASVTGASVPAQLCPNARTIMCG